MFLLARPNSKYLHMTKYQTQILMERFQSKPYLEKDEKQQLAKLLNTSAEKIQRWFINVRVAKRQAGLLGKCEECSSK